ncbi:MAG: tRNA lysidine(34) synthetase TilS [bacterium]
MSSNKKQLEEKFRITIRGNELIEPGDKIIIGFSGGADSSVLLHLLKQIQNQYKLTLKIVYFDHQLRGRESGRETVFVRNILNGLKIPYILKKINTAEYSKSKKLSIEEAGRELRYNYFENYAKKWGFNKVALGHQLDDQAETVLFNITRGTSIAGLKGIPVKRKISKNSSVYVIRPLLNISREDIVKYIEHNDIRYFTDSSNESYKFARNIMRHKVLKYLENINPRVKNHLKNISEDINEWEGFKSNLLRQTLSKIIVMEKDNKMLDLLVFFRYDKFLQKEIISALWQDVSTRVLRREYIEKSIKNLSRKFVQGVQKIRVDDLFKPQKSSKKIKSKAKFKFDPLRKTELNDRGLSIAGRVFYKRSNEFISDQNNAYFDWSKVNKKCFFLRFRNEGDSFCPFGLLGEKKLSDFFIDQKIPAVERDKIPLIYSGRELIWVVGHRTSEKTKVKANTKKVLKLSIKKL